MPASLEVTLAYFFQQRNEQVQGGGDQAEDDDGHQNQIQLEDLAAICDQIAQSGTGCQKFANDDADQCKANVNLHHTDQRGDIAG